MYLAPKAGAADAASLRRLLQGVADPFGIFLGFTHKLLS
jgi:hypothetical protein